MLIKIRMSNSHLVGFDDHGYVMTKEITFSKKRVTKQGETTHDYS